MSEARREPGDQGGANPPKAPRPPPPGRTRACTWAVHKTEQETLPLSGPVPGALLSLPQVEPAIHTVQDCHNLGTAG